MSAGQIGGNITTPYTGIIGHYRRGDFKVLGDNYEEVDAFKNYAFSESLR